MEAFWIHIQQVPPHGRRPETFAYRFATLDAPAKLDALLAEATAWRPDLIVHETGTSPPHRSRPRSACRPPSTASAACCRKPASNAPPPVTAALWERLDLELDPLSGAYRGPYIDTARRPSRTPRRPRAHAPCCCVPQALVAAAAPWQARLAGKRPVVYVTLGTVFNDPGRFGTILTAFAEVDATVLATIGRDNDPADLGPLPENVIVERYVPQADVLPLCDVAVGHAGSGSTLGALATACRCFSYRMAPISSRTHKRAPHLALRGPMPTR